MQIKRFVFILLCVFVTGTSTAQLAGEYMQSRILILLDESSSMTLPWSGGKEKYKAATDLIMRLIDSVYAVNPQVQFGLRVFGHQHTVPENDCYDTRNEVAFSTDNRSQMYLRLLDIRPLGVTPIAFALKEAANKDILDEEHHAYSIILITDGGESCGGDLCEVMKTLIKSKVFFKPYVVSLENDPSLKTVYSCMGDFLQVTKEGEMPGAVSAIVSAFRPLIKISKVDYNEIAARAPSVMKVNTPPAKKQWAPPPSDKLSAVSESGLTIIRIPRPEADIKPVDPGIKLPKVKVIDTLPARTKSVTAAAPLAQLQSFSTKATALRMEPAELPVKLPALKIDTPVAPRDEKIAKLKPAAFSQFNVIFVIEDRTYPYKQVPPLPAVKAEKAPPPEIAKKPPVQEVKVETVEDNQTSVEIYFTNGAGKFYPTTPQVMLVDPSTKQVVKKFYRTVDPAGNPDPQTNIPPGTYQLTFNDNPNFVMNNIKVEANRKNKFFVTVPPISLYFYYIGAPNRPVTEFKAIVTERNKAQGRVQEQKGTEKIKYESGNYHVEINTFPLLIKNIDLDFMESGIGIPQPGFAKFVSDGKVRTVKLYQRLGDKFLPFYSLDLSDPRSQHLQIQPGEYQVHYPKGPGQSASSEFVKLFRITATEVTQIDIN